MPDRMWTVVGVLIGLAVIWIALVVVLLIQQRRARARRRLV